MLKEPEGTMSYMFRNLLRGDAPSPGAAHATRLSFAWRFILACSTIPALSYVGHYPAYLVALTPLAFLGAQCLEASAALTAPRKHFPFRRDLETAYLSAALAWTIAVSYFQWIAISPSLLGVAHVREPGLTLLVFMTWVLFGIARAWAFALEVGSGHGLTAFQVFRTLAKSPRFKLVLSTPQAAPHRIGRDNPT